jgi:hypothetical protein
MRDVWDGPRSQRHGHCIPKYRQLRVQDQDPPIQKSDQVSRGVETASRTWRWPYPCGSHRVRGNRDQEIQSTASHSCLRHIRAQEAFHGQLGRARC